MASSAPPTTAELCAKPDTETPASRAASSAPTVMPMVVPMPPMICVTKSKRRVRRWIGATSTVGAVMTGANTRPILAHRPPVWNSMC
jgi:hypothetical protein